MKSIPIEQNRFIDLAKIIVETGCVKSNSAARRAIEQGAIRIDGNQVKDPFAQVFLDKDNILTLMERATCEQDACNAVVL